MGKYWREFVGVTEFDISWYYKTRIVVNCLPHWTIYWHFVGIVWLAMFVTVYLI